MTPLLVVREPDGTVRLETASGCVLGRAVPLRGGHWRWTPEDVTLIDLRPVHQDLEGALAACRRVRRGWVRAALAGVAPGRRRPPRSRARFSYDAARHAAHVGGRAGGRRPRAVVDLAGRRFGSLAEAAAAYGASYLLVQAWCMRGEGGWRYA